MKTTRIPVRAALLAGTLGFCGISFAQVPSVTLGRPTAVPGTDFRGSTVSVTYEREEGGGELSATLTVGARSYPGAVGPNLISFEIPPEDTVAGELYEGEISVAEGMTRIASAPVTILQGLPFRTWHGGWFDETAAAIGATGTWTPEAPLARGGMMEFDTEEVEGGVIDFAPQTAEPDEAVTVIEATTVFERAIDTDEIPEGFQAGVKLVSVPDGAGGTKPSFAVLASGGWQTAGLAGLDPVANEEYDVRIEICHTNMPRTVAYSVKVGDAYRRLFAGAAYIDRDRVTGVAVKGIGRIREVAADYESVTGADPRLVEADGVAYTNVADALASGCDSFRLRWPATFVPTGGEGDYRIEGGSLTMKAKPAASGTSALVTDGRILHFDTTSGLETLATKTGERLISWKSLLDDGWTAVPGPTYAGLSTLPSVLPRDCGGLPAVKLENFGLTDGQGYLLFQKDGVTREFNGLKSAFWVLGSQEGGGFLFGGGTNTSLSARYNFHRGGTNGTIGASAEQPILSHNPPARVRNASWRLNGEAIAPTKTGLSGGYDVISMALANANDAPVNVDGFAFDGRILNGKKDFQAYAGRCGHQRLCEVIVYDRILSLDERQRTEAYLQRKWGLLEGAAHSAVTLAAGVELNVTGDSPRRFAALGGAGRITGDVAVEALEGVFGEGPLVVSGTLTVPAELVVRLAGVPAEGGRVWIPLAQAANVIGLPSAHVRFEGIPVGRHARLRCRNGVWGADVRDDGLLVVVGGSGVRHTYRAERVEDDEVEAALMSRPHRYRPEPDVERPERAAAAEDAVLVYAADNLTDSYPLQPDGTDVPGEAGAPLAVCACPGERTRATALLWSKSAFEGVTVGFSDLVGAQGAIPASALSAKVVKCWYQGLGAPDRENTQALDQVLVPELMLNDDALVIPDHDNCRNLVRLHEGGRTWYADADTITSASWAEAIPAAELPIADAATLQPFAIRSREGKQLMLRLCVPADAKDGVYSGTVSFAADGRTLATLPIELTVLPFDLPTAAETAYDPSREYTMGLYLWANHAADDADVIAPFPRSRRQLMAEYASLLDNGVTSPTFVWTNGNLFDDVVFRENLSWIREAGFPGTKLHLGSSDNLGSDATDAGILKVTNRVVKALATAREFGFDEVYFYGQDEIKDPEVIANEVKVWRAVHAVGGKVMVSVVEKNRGDFAQCLDLCVHANEPEEVDTAAWHADGTLVWKYGTPQTYVENPRAYRRNYGLQIWKRGFDGANTYCDVGGSAVWNDIASIRQWRESGGAKGNVGRGLTLYYPTEDGVVETLALTGLESAIKDVRYLTRFRQLLRDRPNAAAAAWFDALDPDREDSEAMRKETIGWIRELLAR